jgi:hypothetical protein
MSIDVTFYNRTGHMKTYTLMLLLAWKAPKAGPAVGGL